MQGKFKLRSASKQIIDPRGKTASLSEQSYHTLETVLKCLVMEAVDDLEECAQEILKIYFSFFED